MKELVKLILPSAVFNIDLQLQALVLAGEDKRYIPFDIMDNFGAYRSLSYDPKTQKMSNRKTNDPKTGLEALDVLIPEHLLSRRNSSISPEYASSFNERSYKYNWNVRLFDQAIMQRLSGVAPVVEIGGQPFYYSFQLRQMRGVSDHSLRFQLPRCPPNEPYRCLYDPYKREMVDMNAKISRNVVDYRLAVTMPSPKEIDPIGVARAYGKHDFAYIMDYHCKAVHHAEVIKPDGTRISQPTNEFFQGKGKVLGEFEPGDTTNKKGIKL